MLGLYGMFLGLLAVAALTVSLLWKQRVSPVVFSAGLALAALLVGATYFNQMAIYVRTGVSVYVMMIITGILLFAGGFGLSIKCIRWLITEFTKRPAAS